jgi:hypothetical protein
MNDIPIDRSRRLAIRTGLGLPVALSALSVLGSGCTTPNAIPAPAGLEPLPVPTLRIGDRWRYVLINRYNNIPIGEVSVQVTAVTPLIRLAIDRGADQPVIEEIYTDPWSVLLETVYSGEPIRFNAPMPVVPQGARTGLNLRSNTRYTTTPSSSSEYAWNQRLSVEGWERVTVPAGSFDALRIARLISFEHPDVFRYSPERTDIAWYAPQVGRWVKREWTGSYLMPGLMARGGRAREDWVNWQLTAYQPAPR